MVKNNAPRIFSSIFNRIILLIFRCMQKKIRKKIETKYRKCIRLIFFRLIIWFLKRWQLGQPTEAQIRSYYNQLFVNKSVVYGTGEFRSIVRELMLINIFFPNEQCDSFQRICQRKGFFSDDLCFEWNLCNLLFT